MSFTEIVRHETDDGDELIIGHEGHRGEYVAIIDALGRRELTVQFSDVEFEPHRLVFKYNAYVDRRPHEVAAVECGGPESLGDVGEFLLRVREAVDDHQPGPMEVDV